MPERKWTGKDKPFAMTESTALARSELRARYLNRAPSSGLRVYLVGKKVNVYGQTNSTKPYQPPPKVFCDIFLYSTNKFI